MKQKVEEYENSIPISSFNEVRKKRDLKKEFSVLDSVSWREEHEARVNNDPKFDALNRYIDILPCKKTNSNTFFSQ